MTMNNFAKGPWKLEINAHGAPIKEIIDFDGRGVCEIYEWDTPDAVWRKARLIAHAPELLIELRQAVIQMELAAECLRNGRNDEALLHVSSLMRSKREAISIASGDSE
ncbi:hypothetical protein Kintu_gp43 [Xanthomonas phage Kintu]